MNPSFIPPDSPSRAADIEARREVARQRLDRLEAFLREDPSNDVLAIDAFETALAASAWERARVHLDRGIAEAPDTLGWRLREGDFWLAQHRFDDARSALVALQGVQPVPAGFAAALLHNLAYIDLQQGDAAACIERLAPAMEAPDGAASGSALQCLWLRALHHGAQLSRGMAWAVAAGQQGRLDARAAGPASLIAIDAEDFAEAERWSAACLATAGAGAGDTPVEALVAQASLALAARDAARAALFSDAALNINAADGRSWSVRAFADLLAGDLPAAHAAFARAMAAMPGHIGTWHGKGWTEILQGDLVAAERSFAQAMALDRTFTENHGGLAVVLALQGRKAEAEQHAETALRLDASNVSGRYAQALLSGQASRPADVQRLARRLLGGRAAPLGGAMEDFLKNH